MNEEKLAFEQLANAHGPQLFGEGVAAVSKLQG